MRVTPMCQLLQSPHEAADPAQLTTLDPCKISQVGLVLPHPEPLLLHAPAVAAASQLL